jgi:nicotinamidase-related amidase
MSLRELPIPSFFDGERVSEVWRVPYQERAVDAQHWREIHRIESSTRDRHRVCLLLVDVQNTFCIPDFELYVGGRSGTGAVDDNQRLTQFIYKNLSSITQICPTMDTHQAVQIFHSIFLVDQEGMHPEPYTLITVEDIEQGVWRFNPVLSDWLDVSEADAGAYLKHYGSCLKAGGKYDLTIWPYHAMLGGIGHALVSAVEEAIFFHTVSRYSQADYQIKGNHILTENYSVLKPEIMRGVNAEEIAPKNQELIEKLLSFDALIIAGQAKSHCVAWTVADLLTEIEERDASLAGKIYLLTDCTSPVVIPEVIDYTDSADEAYKRFQSAGMHLVSSTQSMATWPNFPG